MKKIQKVLLTVLIAAVISTIAGFWIFEINWPFLPFPLLAGLAIVLVQKEKTSYKFISKLIAGSLLFGFLTLLLIYTRMYLFSPDFPFWPLYNPKEYLIFSLIFSFICLLGGLIGIVLQGFYFLSKNRDRAVKP
jgi:hypothetical protein